MRRIKRVVFITGITILHIWLLACEESPKKSILAESKEFNKYVLDIAKAVSDYNNAWGVSAGTSANQERTAYEKDIRIESYFTSDELSKQEFLTDCYTKLIDFIQTTGGQILTKGELESTNTLATGMFLNYEKGSTTGKLELWIIDKKKSEYELIVTIVED